MKIKVLWLNQHCLLLPDLKVGFGRIMGRFKVGYCGKRRSLLGRLFEKILELTPATTLWMDATRSPLINNVIVFPFMCDLVILKYQICPRRRVAAALGWPLPNIIAWRMQLQQWRRRRTPSLPLPIPRPKLLTRNASFLCRTCWATSRVPQFWQWYCSSIYTIFVKTISHFGF